MPDRMREHADARKSRALFQNGDYRIVREAMAGLTPRQRAVIHLRFWEGKSTTEIAATLKIDWETAWETLQAALSVLKASCLATPGFSRATVHAIRGAA